MTVSLNSVTIPETIRTRGKYKFERQAPRQAADGTVYRAGVQTVTWQWDEMDFTDFDWLVAHISETSTVAAVLWDDTRTEQSFSGCVIHRPTFDNIHGAAYMNVVLSITHLMPLL